MKKVKRPCFDSAVVVKNCDDFDCACRIKDSGTEWEECSAGGQSMELESYLAIVRVIPLSKTVCTVKKKGSVCLFNDMTMKYCILLSTITPPKYGRVGVMRRPYNCRKTFPNGIEIRAAR